MQHDQGMQEVMAVARRQLRVLTWNDHGSYLRSLATTGHELLVIAHAGDPLLDRRHRLPGNVTVVPATAARQVDADVVLCQSERRWARDRLDQLDERQLGLPHVYVEHDPPSNTSSGARHPVDDPRALLVHSTPFNELMWDAGQTPTRVIEPGVAVSDDLSWTGIREAGLTVVRGRTIAPDRRGTAQARSREHGIDLHEHARASVPLDLVNVSPREQGAAGLAWPAGHLPAIAASWRFLFQPSRNAGLDITVCEAMMIGMPVVSTGTAEHVIAIRDSGGGFADTSLDRLVGGMQSLLLDRDLARQLGARARQYARERFPLERFQREWNETLADMASSQT